MSRRIVYLSHIGRRAKMLVACVLALFIVPAVPGRAQSANDPIYVFHTSLGDMRVQLFPDIAPQTVANFVNYVNRGAYSGSFIHRVTTIANSGIAVVQGGGYVYDNTNGAQTIPTDAPVQNEFSLPNTRGTIAMAKTSDPNSATDQWFFNETDNSASLDNPNNSGGFTVFGRVVDSASLAVMDTIATLQVINAGSAFNQLPVINYTSGAVTGSNLVYINAITPPSSWRAVSVSAGADGFTRILWDNLNGTAAVWKVDAQGQLVSQQQYGPYTGWTCQAVSTGQDNQTRVLWTHTSGAAALWVVDPNNNYVGQQQYGPFSGWACRGISAAPDGGLRALWTTAGGAAALWRLDGQNRYLDQQQYGPYTGWTAKSLTVNPNGQERLLWDNVGGAAAFWRLSAQNQYVDQQQYGPFSGFTAQSIASAPDGTGRVVWTATDAHIALWTIDGSNAYAGQTQFGPFSGWAYQGLSVGNDGNPRLLWDNYSGQSALWSISPSGGFAANTLFGPY